MSACRPLGGVISMNISLRGCLENTEQNAHDNHGWECLCHGCECNDNAPADLHEAKVFSNARHTRQKVAIWELKRQETNIKDGA